jgi:hypothetical protein
MRMMTKLYKMHEIAGETLRMADLRKWFHPLVLINEQNVTPYRNSSTSIYQILQHVYGMGARIYMTY